MCFAGIEAEIRDMPAQEVPPPQPASPGPAEPRTQRLHPSGPSETLSGQRTPVHPEPQAA